jgi:hypothetical protein
MKTGAPSRWPSHCDIFGYLRDQARPIELKEIIARVGYSERCSMRAINDLHKLGIIHIHAWRPAVGGGYPAKLWKCWPGKDAEKPPRVTQKQARLAWYHRKINEMTEKYGRKIARKMVYSKTCGGADKIVIDGKTVYARRDRPGRPARSAE